MLLRVQTEVSGDVFILRCDGRIVFGDEGAVLRDRVINLLSGTPKIVVNLNGVDYIDSGGFGILVGLFISAKKRGGMVDDATNDTLARMGKEETIWAAAGVLRAWIEKPACPRRYIPTGKTCTSERPRPPSSYGGKSRSPSWDACVRSWA